MTSGSGTPQPQSQNNAPTTSPNTTPATQVSGKSSTVSNTQSYAHATRKSISQSATSETAPSAAVAANGTTRPAGSQHGPVPSASVNGTNMAQPGVPVVGGPTIVNGSTGPNTDHSRKPSVTISAAAGSSFGPNCAPVGPASTRAPAIQFGAVDSQGSPAAPHATLINNTQQSTLGVGGSGNPRVTSPQTSPSPIPVSVMSGGRPPSLQGHGSSLSFGNFSGESADTNRANRPVPSASGMPGTNHFRKESSPSTHPEMGNHVLHPGPGRGAYRGGRGNFSHQPHGHHQMGYPSPNMSYRSPSNPGRGGHNMNYNHHTPNRFPNSPGPARSPALAAAHPVPRDMGPPMAMGTPPMQNQFYPPMGQQGYPFDPYSYYGYQPAMPVPPMPFGPASPRQGYGIPPTAGPFVPPAYPTHTPAPMQGPPLSRSPSQISGPERPNSSVGQQAVPMNPSHSHSGSRTANSPVPKPSTPQFVLPAKNRTSKIMIRDPKSNEQVTFDKQSSARGTPSPQKSSAIPATTAVAPSGTPSRTDSEPNGEEKKQAFANSIAQKAQQAKADAEAKKKAEEEAAEAEKKADEAKEQKEKAEAEAKEAETKKAAEEAQKKEEERRAAAKEEETKAAPAEDEIDFDAIEREMAEVEAKEQAAEAAYYERKRKEREDKARKEKEEAEAYEANMKNAEREAERLEEAKEKERMAEASKAEKPGFTPSPLSASTTSAQSGVATPAPDTSMGPPPKPTGKRDKPSALKLETSKNVEPPQPSAALKSLQSARFLQDPTKVSYPPNIASPNPALNASAPPDRKFKYNKEFLLQFQKVFQEKPSLDWDFKVRETVGDSTESSRTSSSARTPAPRTPRMSGGSFPLGGGFGPIRSMSGSGRTSLGPSNPFAGFGQGPIGMPPPMNRVSSSSLPHAPPPRVGSHRGNRQGSKREKPSKKDEEKDNKSMPLTAGGEFKPLVTSSTGWKPISVMRANVGPALGGDNHMPPDMVQRKVKASLNKMTPENFDRISDQILSIVEQSKNESDGRTLRQVIQLTFEKATDEAHWAQLYARFAKRMLDTMSPEIRDENIKDRQGNVVGGGSLFRKYLLNRCQEEFERGWKVNLPPKPEGSTEEAAMMSDEYYIAAAAKRRGLGLVKFIGELFKLGMLTERIMHNCVYKLVDFEGTPDEAEIESLTNLLRTIGHQLDSSEKGHSLMDAYFDRINSMMHTPNLPSRLYFMLLDIVDLRKTGWRSKEAEKGPKTIQEIRAQAARAQQEQEMERARQTSRGGRMAMGRGDARFSGNFSSQAPPQDFTSSKVGTDDLRRLKTTRNTSQPTSFGPTSMLGSRSSSGRNKAFGPGGNLVRNDSHNSSRSGTPGARDNKKEEKEASSSINAFSALAGLDASDSLATSPPSHPTSPNMTKGGPATDAGKGT